MSQEGLFDYLNRFSANIELHKDGTAGYEVRFVFPHGHYLDLIKKDLKKYGIDYEDKTNLTVKEKGSEGTK